MQHAVKLEVGKCWAFPVLALFLIVFHTLPTCQADDVTTQAGLTISGVIRGCSDASTRGVTVTLSGSASAVTTSSQGLGAFQFDGLAPGTYTLTPSKTNYTYVPASETVTLSTANKSVGFSPGYSLSGRITDHGVGLASTTVTLKYNTLSFLPDPGTIATTITDQNGSYAFSSVTTSSYIITPTKTGVTFVPDKLEPSIGCQNISNLNFESGYVVSGKVTTGGLPTSDIALTLQKKQPDGTFKYFGEAYTDDEGKYAFKPAPPGTYIVQPTGSQFSFAPSNRQVAIDRANINDIEFAINAVGFTINEAAIFTNSPEVMLSVNPPAGSTEMLVSNDGGFISATAFPLSSSQPWTLLSAGEERIPKTVYMRFVSGGSTDTQTFADDIILDQTVPVLLNAKGKKGKGIPDQELSKSRSAAVGKAGPVLKISIKARDNLSGLAMLQISSNKSNSAPWMSYRSTLTIPLPRKSNLWLRVQDGAGNNSNWKKIGLE